MNNMVFVGMNVHKERYTVDCYAYRPNESAHSIEKGSKILMKLTE